MELLPVSTEEIDASYMAFMERLLPCAVSKDINDVPGDILAMKDAIERSKLMMVNIISLMAQGPMASQPMITTIFMAGFSAALDAVERRDTPSVEELERSIKFTPVAEDLKEIARFEDDGGLPEWT